MGGGGGRFKQNFEYEVYVGTHFLINFLTFPSDLTMRMQSSCPKRRMEPPLLITRA